MRDVDTDFGTISTAASAAYTEFPYGVNAGEGGNLGKICKLYVRVKIEGSKAVPSTDTISIQDIELRLKPFRNTLLNASTTK